MSSGFPTPDIEVTLLLVVSDAERSKLFYRDVLGAELYREYGGTSVVLRFQGTWLLLVTRGGRSCDSPFDCPRPTRTIPGASPWRRSTRRSSSSWAAARIPNTSGCR